MRRWRTRQSWLWRVFGVRATFFCASLPTTTTTTSPDGAFCDVCSPTRRWDLQTHSTTKHSASVTLADIIQYHRRNERLFYFSHVALRFLFFCFFFRLETLSKATYEYEISNDVIIWTFLFNGLFFLFVDIKIRATIWQDTWLSVRRCGLDWSQILATVFYQTFTNVFVYFFHFLTILTFFICLIHVFAMQYW